VSEDVVDKVEIRRPILDPKLLAMNLISETKMSLTTNVNPEATELLVDWCAGN